MLNDGAHTGTVNMARDEALLTVVGDGSSPPTLRLYEWVVPTISLGYFQRYADYESLQPPARGLPVVRRLTGGGAILHDQELTYSLVLPADHTAVAGRPNRLYELAHDALVSCLRDHGVDSDRCHETDDSGPTKGPFFCFARRHRCDVLIGSQKVAGSAQRRTRGGLLQHGSIMLGQRFVQQPTASLSDFGVDAEWLRARLPAALGDAMAMLAEPGEWTIEERQTAGTLQAKYASAEWTQRQSRGVRTSAVGG